MFEFHVFPFTGKTKAGEGTTPNTGNLDQTSTSTEENILYCFPIVKWGHQDQRIRIRVWRLTAVTGGIITAVRVETVTT